MVSIIKNQLLKHLSRFTKNLSADKINLNTFKGEGELSNLELNENVLTDLLELPSWLRLKSAWCNKVGFRIQWTQLKKVPIVLSLDEVNIIVETCEELRTTSTQSGASTAVPGKYSYIHKIIDGITVQVNTVNITFNSPAFTANVQISRILVESKNPRWKKADLRMTRLKEPEKGQLLIFKELEWQTVRIEAKSTVDKNLTPLRLLTNQARCRITIKKRLSDSYIMGSRLVVILDDLLWVLTDSQLKAALHFLDSLAGLVQKATQVTRKAKAARKLEELPEYQAHLAQEARVKDGESEISKIFASWDVVETSYHFLSHQIVLHLCDDVGPGRSCHPNLKDGGALQISLQHFQVDYFPYHLAKCDRKHWPRYREASIPHVHWQEQSLNSFRTRFLELIDRNKSQHTPLTRSNKGTKADSMGEPQPQQQQPLSSEQPRRMSAHNQNQVKAFAVKQLAKLMTSCVIMRVEDFTIYKVTTSGKKQSLKEFITGDRDHMSLPAESRMVHAEFTYFYYPDDTPFPLPPPKFYVQVNPIQIIFDVDSCLWFNSFALNLHQSLLDSKQDMSGSNLTYIDVKIEAILPRIIFESAKEYHIQKDRPRNLTFQVTRVTITNVRSLEQSSRADLAKCVDSFHMGSLFFGTEFPSKPNDFNIVTQKFLDHISTKDNIRTLPTELDTTSIDALFSQLSRSFLWTEAKDVWCINLEPVWADFHGARASNKPVPFFDAVPVTVWLHTNMDPNSTVKVENELRSADIHALAHLSNLVSVQLNHYQYLFLLRLAEDAAELATFLNIDSSRITKVESDGSIIFGALIPQLEVTFVMPSQTPGKESSGADVESFMPESSSIADDILVAGSTATVWQNSTLSMTQIQTSFESCKKPVPNGAGTPISEMSSSYSMDFVQHAETAKPVAKQSNPTFPNIPNNLNADITPQSEEIWYATSSSCATSPVNNNKGTNIISANNTQNIANNPNTPPLKSPPPPTTTPRTSEDSFELINASGSSSSGVSSEEYIFVSDVRSFGRTGISSMKKGFSSLMTSIDSALKPNVDDASDTLSIKSDVSSDSENYVFLSNIEQDAGNNVDGMFYVPEFLSSKLAVELASEVIEEESTVTTTSDHSFTSSCRRKDLVYVSTFKLNKVEFLQQSVGYSSAIKLQIGNICNEDCSSIPWDEFQGKFASRSRAWSDNPTNASTTTRIRLRMDHGIALPPNVSMTTMDFSNLDHIRRLFRDNIELQVSDLHLIVSMCTVIGLADLVEDEIIPVPVPLNISLSNVQLQLNEDRPPVNITSPGSIPIEAKITELYVTRGEDGIFQLYPNKVTTISQSYSTLSAEENNILDKQINKQLKLDNDELRRRLQAFERISEENRTLRRAKEETDILRSCLSSSQEEVTRLLEEKKKLLDEIRKMQEQFLNDRSRQWASKR